MIFLNIKKVIMLSSCCLILDAVNLNCMSTPQDTNIACTQVQAGSRSGGKKLTGPEMDLLNALLKDYITPVLRMDFAYKATLKVTKEIESSGRSDKQFITEQIKSILAPVKQFFTIVHEYAGMVKPLVEESLLSKVGSPEEQALERSNCLILKFFESKDETDAFFSKHVSTKEELIKACKEFTIFFEDIRISLSDRVLEAYQATLEKLKNNQKQSTTCKPA